VISPQAIHLLGASTKRNDQSKIGQFGSGNKYALAYFLRNGYDLKIYAGLEEIAITTKAETFRDQSFDVIYVNGERTSITTGMGVEWKFWQAIRELYCNAIDEGGHSLDFVQEITPVEGETHFYIDTKKDVMEFVTNFDDYFATKKKVLFDCKYGRILEKTGTNANIYRKGVKCFISNKTSVFDYDFNEIDIDENRLVKYFWEVEQKIWKLVYECDNKEMIMSVLGHSADHNYLEGCLSEISTISAYSISDAFKECLQRNKFAPAGYAGMLKPDEVHQHIIVPTKIFKSVRSHIPDENVGDRFKTTKRGDMYREIEPDSLQEAIIVKAEEFLTECGFKIPYVIKVAIFESKEIGGAAIGETIYLSDIGIEKGVSTVVNIIIEEYIHIKYDCADETREFQTAAITELVSYMKQKNAYLI
jgi:hypothetical protein